MDDLNKDKGIHDREAYKKNPTPATIIIKISVARF
jgi:hypothetical protein